MEESGAYAPALRSLEICAGAGGQALGLERAGFELEAAVELDAAACATLRLNRPSWDVRQVDVHDFSGRAFDGIDLLAGGVPCPPFSIAGKQLGSDDERDLFPEMLRLVAEANPRAVMIENVRGLLSKRFTPYRATIIAELESLGYVGEWRLFHASDFGVPQLRPRSILVAMRREHWQHFVWPVSALPTPTVGSAIGDLMASRKWPGAAAWKKRAAGIAPTLVGGSKKHGGPDLGPTRARQQWANLGVDGKGLADEAPGKDFPKDAMPRLTIPMVARVQGFPDDWSFFGRKTAQYRQVGNAFPPPVAAAIATEVANALHADPTQSGARTVQVRLMETSLSFGANARAL